MIFKRKDSIKVLLEIDSPRIIQGYVEASNVNIVDQMMEMISLERIYNWILFPSSKDGSPPSDGEPVRGMVPE